MVFSAVSMVYSFEVDDDTDYLARVGKKQQPKTHKTNNNCMLCCAILMQFNLE